MKSEPVQHRIQYREHVLPTDHDAVYEIVTGAGVFSSSEAAVAVELVRECLLRGVQSGYNFLFAESSEGVIGYACFGPVPATRGSYDLYWIAVLPRYRRQGIGRELLARTEDEIRQKGGRRIYVETSSRPTYAPTQRFYVSCGYESQGSLEDYYDVGDAKVIYLKVI